MDLLAQLEFGLGEALYASAVLLAAAFVRGYGGFGFSAVLVAGLVFVIEPVAAVPLAIAFEVVASVVQGRSIWHEVRWRDFWILLAAAVIGNPIGVVVLTRLDGEILRAATFTVLALLSAGMLVGHRGRVAPTAGLMFAVGVLAGVVNGATALSGLVIVLAMSFTTMTPAPMRATLVAYFFASDAVVLGILAIDGSIASSLFSRVLVGIPILALGIVVGSKAFRRSSVETFRRITLALLITISVVGLARVLAG